MNDKDRKLLEILVKYFKQDTMFLSSVESRHPYFKSIVAIGRSRPNVVIPFLLELVEEDGDLHWHLALHMIVGEKDSPAISEEMRGRVDLIRQAWLDWDKLRGYT